MRIRTLLLAMVVVLMAIVVVATAAETMSASRLASLNLQEIKTITVIAGGDSIKVTYRPLYGVVVDSVVTQVFYGKDDAMRHVIDHKLYGAEIKRLNRKEAGE